MLADISYGRNILGFKGIPEISEDVNKITILAMKLKGERFEDLQRNEVAQLLTLRKCQKKRLSAWSQLIREKNEKLMMKLKHMNKDFQSFQYQSNGTGQLHYDNYPFMECNLLFKNGKDDQLLPYQEKQNDF
jgi:hypothetical protein